MEKQGYRGPSFPPTDKGQYYVEEASEGNEDAFDAAEILCAAASSGDVKSLEWMLDDLKIPVDIPYERHGVTALSYACAAGEAGAVKYLLARGANVNIHDPETGWAAIHHTVHSGFDNITEMLLECGASIDSKDVYGWTPLHHASNDGHVNVSRLLVKKGASLDEEDNSGQTPLYVATETVIKALIPSISLETKLGTLVSFGITILGMFVTYHGAQENITASKVTIVLVFPVLLLVFFVYTWTVENSKIRKARESIRRRSDGVGRETEGKEEPKGKKKGKGKNSGAIEGEIEMDSLESHGSPVQRGGKGPRTDDSPASPLRSPVKSPGVAPPKAPAGSPGGKGKGKGKAH